MIQIIIMSSLLIPEDLRRKNMAKWSSRKFLMGLATFLLIVLNELLSLGIPAETYWAIVTPVIFYIAAEAYVDGQ